MANSDMMRLNISIYASRDQNFLEVEIYHIHNITENLALQMIVRIPTKRNERQIAFHVKH